MATIWSNSSEIEVQPVFERSLLVFWMTGQMRCVYWNLTWGGQRAGPVSKKVRPPLKRSRLQQSTFANTTSDRFIVGSRRATLEASFSGPSKVETPLQVETLLRDRRQ